MSLEIKELADDELITEPGFYRISLERHHNQPCDGPSVTSGNLRMMEKHGPSKFWDRWSFNPDRTELPKTDALRLGAAMAYLIEGGLTELMAHFQVLPDDHPSRPTKAQYTALRRGQASASAKASIAFWGDINKSGRDILSQKEYELLIAMGGKLADDPAAKAALGGEPELTMAWQCRRTGLWCLARPDNLRTDGLLSDYKKVNTQGRAFTQHFCSKLTENNGYDQQMAFANEGFTELTGNSAAMIGLIFQEDESPHDVILQEIQLDEIGEAEYLNMQSRLRIQECLKSGNWPKDGAIGYFRRSEVGAKAIQERMTLTND